MTTLNYVSDITGLSVRSLEEGPRKRKVRGTGYIVVETSRKITKNLLDKVYGELAENGKPEEMVETKSVVDYPFKIGRGKNATHVIMRTTPDEDELTILVSE